MKIKLNQPLLALDGKTVMLDSEGNDMTLKDAMIAALMTDISPGQNEQPESGQNKNMNFLLAQDIYRAGKEIDLKPEQIVSIKGKVGKLWTTAIVGRVFAMLDKAG